jgi:hypothetical protein
MVGFFADMSPASGHPLGASRAFNLNGEAHSLRGPGMFVARPGRSRPDAFATRPRIVVQSFRLFVGRS